jgi:hypothetical protein
MSFAFVTSKGILPKPELRHIRQMGRSIPGALARAIADKALNGAIE